MLVILKASPTLSFAHEGVFLELTDKFHEKWNPSGLIVSFLFGLSMPLPHWHLKRIVQLSLIVSQIKVVA